MCLLEARRCLVLGKDGQQRPTKFMVAMLCHLRRLAGRMIPEKLEAVLTTLEHILRTSVCPMIVRIVNERLKWCNIVHLIALIVK